jgi:hypothetical protein
MISLQNDGVNAPEAEDINKDRMNMKLRATVTDSNSKSQPGQDEASSGRCPSVESTVPLQSMLDLMTLAREMQEAMVLQGLVKDRTWHLKTYKNCFLHQAGFRWLIDKVLVMEQAMPSSGDNAGGCVVEAAAVCSSFKNMEHYLDELKVKAARLGNLMIKAGYLSHVSDDHQFDVHHKSKVILFRFHLETSVRKSNDKVKNVRSILKRNTDIATVEKPSDSTFETKASPEGSGASDFNNAQPVAEVDTNTPYSDVFSVMSAHEPDQVADVGLFYLARDFHSDLRFFKKIKDRTFHLKKYKKCFLHKDGMEWLSRQVQIQYKAGREAPAKKGETNVGETSLPDLLTKEQSEEIAARIGNLMIQHGYVSHVCENHVFRPNVESMLFFEFRENVINADYEMSKIWKYNDTHIDNLQQTLFERETRTTLTSLPRAPESPKSPKK